MRPRTILLLFALSFGGLAILVSVLVHLDSQRSARRVGPGAGVVSGRVVSTSGTPREGIRVGIAHHPVRDRNRRGLLPRIGYEGEVRSAADGSFEFRGLEPDRFVIVAAFPPATGDAVGTRVAGRVGDDPLEIVLEEYAPLDVRLVRAGGRGAPVRGGFLYVCIDDGTPAGWSGVRARGGNLQIPPRDGFSFGWVGTTTIHVPASALERGGIELTAEGHGCYLTKATGVSSREFDFPLVPLGVIEVELRDAKGEPIAEASFGCSPSPKAWSAGLFDRASIGLESRADVSVSWDFHRSQGWDTDGKGRARIEGLASGVAYVVRTTIDVANPLIDSFDLVGESAAWDAESESHPPLVLRVPSADECGTVTGRITRNGSAERLSGVLRGERADVAFTPQPDGSFELEGVPAGRTTLELWLQSRYRTDSKGFVHRSGNKHSSTLDFAVIAGDTVRVEHDVGPNR
jgi:hypothetical protein